MFLPVKNARLLSVSRGQRTGTRDPYSTVAPAAATLLFEGAADALVTTKRVVVQNSDGIDLVGITLIVVPAVCEIEAGDQVEIVKDGVATTYTIRNVTPDAGGMNPWPALQLTTENQ